MMEQSNLNDKISERILEWLAKLDEGKKNHVRILDAYFQSRSNLPMKSVTGEEYIEEHKSTLDIIDDLADMELLDINFVAEYMTQHEYGLITTEDGKVKWAVWRDFHFLI